MQRGPRLPLGVASCDDAMARSRLKAPRAHPRRNYGRDDIKDGRWRIAALQLNRGLGHTRDGRRENFRTISNDEATDNRQSVAGEAG